MKKTPLGVIADFFNILYALIIDTAVEDRMTWIPNEGVKIYGWILLRGS